MNILSNFNLAGMDFMYALGLLGIFTGIFMLVACINHYILEPIRWRRQINQRLKGNKREQAVRAKIFKALQETQRGPILQIVERLTGWGSAQNLEKQLLQADIYLSPNIFLSLVAGLGMAGFFIATMFTGLLGSVGIGMFTGMLPILFMRWKKRRKTAKFERYMPDAMELLARSLRAGHTLQGTLELVAQEIPDPLGTEMRITYEEQRLGLSVPQAFRRMGDRVASRDLQYFVTAVLIQTETGGNLAEILENIGTIIRDRLKLKAKVQGLTAEGRFSALILGLLPFLTFAALFFINREYLMVLFINPVGHKILTAGLINIIIGALVMKKMVSIKI